MVLGVLGVCPRLPVTRKFIAHGGGGATLTRSGSLVFGVGGVCGVGFLVLVTDLMEN